MSPDVDWDDESRFKLSSKERYVIREGLFVCIVSVCYLINWLFIQKAKSMGREYYIYLSRIYFVMQIK